MIERPGGNCGIGTTESLVTGDGSREGFETLAPGCTGWRKLSGDACTVDMDQRCESRDASGALLGHTRMVGYLEFVTDDRVEGLVQLDVVTVDGATCSAEFDLSGRPAR